MVNKERLVDAVCERAGVNRKTAELVIKATIDGIIDGVAQGKRVTLMGFGSFQLRKRMARQGRNPSTGEVIDIPEKLVPVFMPSKGFKNKVALLASPETHPLTPK